MKIKVAVLLAVVLLGPLFLTASSGEEAGHDFWGGFLKKALNSVILFGGLFYLLRKPILKFLSEKSVEVKDSMLQLEKQLADKKRELKTVLQRMEEIEKEVRLLKTRAEKTGKEENKRIRELADAESIRIRDLTETEINQKIHSAVRTLKKRVTEEMVAEFERELGKRLDEALHKKIIKTNIKLSGEIIARE